jgi:hypothetical protein
LEFVGALFTFNYSRIKFATLTPKRTTLTSSAPVLACHKHLVRTTGISWQRRATFLHLVKFKFSCVRTAWALDSGIFNITGSTSKRAFQADKLASRISRRVIIWLTLLLYNTLAIYPFMWTKAFEAFLSIASFTIQRACLAKQLAWRISRLKLSFRTTIKFTLLAVTDSISMWALRALNFQIFVQITWPKKS